MLLFSTSSHLLLGGTALTQCDMTCNRHGPWHGAVLKLLTFHKSRAKGDMCSTLC
jgi:hypothetical protein